MPQKREKFTTRPPTRYNELGSSKGADNLTQAHIKGSKSMDVDRNYELFEDTTSSKQSSRKGPPNRMNDLTYTDWMKFQKSFFRYRSSSQLADECVKFFTKALWPDESRSRSLLIGWDYEEDSTQRLIDHYRDVESTEKVIEILGGLVAATSKPYDFVLIDLRPHIRSLKDLDAFLTGQAERLFRLLTSLMVPERYCGIAVGVEGAGGNGFQFPWMVADASRPHLRLCDEKIGLVESDNSVFYLLFMRNQQDERTGNHAALESIRLGKTDRNIPAWTIPKPPPRKKNEILHPGKFPETLVAQFIELFTNPGDNIFDPMVGTGSAVVAAVTTNRHGYGLDLVPEYVAIANKRVLAANPPRLFPEEGMASHSLVLEGDATKLGEIPELKQLKFHYAITSPPYWSMLSNPGSEGQRARKLKNLPLVYSQDNSDLGNIQDYDQFLNLLNRVYQQVSFKLFDNAILTVIVKNVKRNHVMYSLAWDLTCKLCGPEGNYEYLGSTLWCQDDISVKPFAVGIYWVSNTLHQYCIHFRKRKC